MAKAVLLDAKNKNITRVEVNDGEDIRRLVGCNWFTCVTVYSEVQRATCYVDDEGLLNGLTYGFYLGGQLLMGNGLLVGFKNGDDIDLLIPMCVIEEIVTFLEVDP